MSEIEAGEYYRTEKGKIHKWSKGRTYIGQDKIIKHSKNIIDLIEEGDYVNGKEVYSIDTAIQIPIGQIINCKDGTFIIDTDIKSIVTKEMMKSIEYKIGG